MKSVLKFFAEFYEKGCQYSSVTPARIALASSVTIKGVHHFRPQKPKYYSIWDADVLLRYWEQIEDNSQLNLQEISKMVTALLELLHGLRKSITVTFDINLIKR